MSVENDSRRGFDMARLVPVVVVLLIVMAFFIGNLSAKVAFLEKNGNTTGTVANNGGTQPAAGQPAPVLGVQIDKEKFNELADGSHIIGKKNAKIAMVEFSDFQCPYCEKFFSGAYPQIKKEYIDTGKIKLVYRHFPLTAIHPYAMGAAIASECASEQGKFEAYHDKLFANQTAITKDDLKKYAGDLGLNTGKFNDCLDREKYKDRVEADTKLGTDSGINATPGFFVNGKQITGAQPFENFKSVIEEALKS